MTNVTVNTGSNTPNVVTADPVTNDGRVMVRQTVTGMEQCIAAGAGLITAGPLGAAAAWGMIKGVQGKWAPWTVCGFVAAPILGIIQLAAFTDLARDSHTRCCWHAPVWGACGRCVALPPALWFE